MTSSLLVQDITKFLKSLDESKFWPKGDWNAVDGKVFKRTLPGRRSDENDFNFVTDKYKFTDTDEDDEQITYDAGEHDDLLEALCKPQVWGRMEELAENNAVPLSAVTDLLPVVDAAAVPVAATIKSLKASAGANGVETPYDIMPLATLDPATAMAPLRPFGATAVRLKDALARYRRYAYIQDNLWHEVMSSPGIMKFEAFVNHVAEAYPSTFEPPSDKILVDMQSGVWTNMVSFSDFRKKADAAQAEYMAMWDVYRRVRNTMTMIECIVERLRPTEKVEDVVRSTCNDFLWLLTDLYNILSCGELSEADYIVTNRLKAIQDSVNQLKARRIHELRLPLQVANKQRLYGNDILITEQQRSTLYGVCHFGLPQDAAYSNVSIDVDPKGIRMRAPGTNPTASICWLSLPPDDPSLQFGYVKVPWTTTKYAVKFPKTLPSPNFYINVWLTGFQLHARAPNTPSPELKVSVVDDSETTSGFTLSVSHGTLPDNVSPGAFKSSLKSTSVGWIACTEDRNGNDIVVATHEATVPTQISSLGKDSRIWNAKTWNSYGFRGNEDGSVGRPPQVASFVSGCRTFGAVKALTQTETCKGGIIDTDTTAWVQWVTVAYRPPSEKNVAVMLEY